MVHDYRDRQLVSLIGTLRLERAYYYCGTCGQGCCPFDHAAGLDERHLTPAVQRLTTLAESLVAPAFVDLSVDGATMDVLVCHLAGGLSATALQRCGPCANLESGHHLGPPVYRVPTRRTTSCACAVVRPSRGWAGCSPASAATST